MAHNFNADPSITPTFQTLPGASFVVNGAAQVHDSALTTATAEMDHRLVGRSHLRGRALQRHHKLCRQGRGAVFVVSRRLPFLARSCRSGMSAGRSQSGGKRT